VSGRPILLVALLALGATAAPAGATYPGTNGLIVYERASANGPPSDLHVVSPDGTGDRRVFATAGHESEGTFSPTNNAQTAFVRAPFRRGDFTGPPQIYVGDLVTGLARRITHFDAEAIAPTFSPDGTRIVFFSTKGSPQAKNAPPAFHIFTIKPDGTGLRRLTRGAIFSFDPDWSPDGTKIVFCEGKMVRKDVFQNRVAVMNADGTGRHALSSFGDPDEINPKWFPDGKGITYEKLIIKRGAPTDSNIMFMNPDGTGVVALLATRAYETNPIPSPDGTKIAFTSDRDRLGRDRLGRGFELYTMNVDGTQVTRLTNNRSTDAFPDWQRLP
jgi:Tol biopolymer transport system component